MSTDSPTDATHLQALADTTSDALLTIDTDSRIQYVNPAIKDVLGYTPEELVDESLTVLMSAELADRHLNAVEQYLATGTRTLDWERIELPGKHKDGHEVPLEVTFSEFTKNGDRYFSGILRDISDRKELEAERELLHASTEQAATADTFSEGLSNVLRLVGESMNWVCGEAWAPAAGGDRIERKVVWESDDTDLGEFGTASADVQFEPGDGLVGRVWTAQEYEWVEDVSTADASTSARTAAAAEQGLQTALAVPIRADDSVVAVLVFMMRNDQSIDERMVAVTRTIASNLGLLMERKRARNALREERDLVANILEATPTGIVVAERNGDIEYVNDQAVDLLRLDSTEDSGNRSLRNPSYDVLDADGNPLADSERPHRAVFETGAAVDRDLELVFPDGDRRWLAVRGTSLRDDAGEVTRAILAFEDITERRRHVDQLERLNELGQALSESQSFDDACKQVVTAAQELVGCQVATIRRYDADTGGLEPCAYAVRDSEGTASGSLFDTDRGLLWEAFAQSEPRVYDDLSQATDIAPAETQLDSMVVLPLGKHGVLVAGETTQNGFSARSITTLKILASNTESAFDRLDREVALQNRKSELEQTNEQLRRVQRVNRRIRNITEVLMDANSKAEIQRRVCQQLADSDTYRFVWYGEHDLASEEIVPAASAGVEEGYLDEITVTADTSEVGKGPTGRALRTHEAQIQNDLQSDPPFEPWRREAMQRDYRASIAVPVIYEEKLYGLLNLYANEANIFTGMEQAVLTELGQMIGYALNAMERYEALVAENSVELKFEIRDFTDPLLDLLQEHDGRFKFENIRGRENGTLRVFGTFEDIPFETIQRLIASSESGEDAKLIRASDGESIVELGLGEDSFLARLLDRGARPTSIRATPERGITTIRIAKTASVREYVDLFEERYDDVELVSRRDNPEPVQSEPAFEQAYLERLTERQQDVLQTAYYAGFFDQPRENDARDIAEMLDVSQPTVSRHIRAGEKKLFSALFGDTAG